MNMRKLINLLTESSRVSIKPSSDDVGEVSAANATYGFVGDKGLAPIDRLNGGADVSQPSERKRVDVLKQAITAPEGYFSRIIVDGIGNVVEGQHRFSAARELGWKKIPVQQIIDISDHIDDKVIDHVMKVGGLSHDRASQVVCNVVGNIYEDRDMSGDYDHMGSSWAPAFNAALDGIKSQGGLHNMLWL